MPNTSIPSKNSKRRLDLQVDIPPEIKGSILEELSPKDVKNLGETCKGFNAEAKRLQFKILNLNRILENPDEHGKRMTIDELIERLSTSAVKGGLPLSTHVREVEYSERSMKGSIDKELTVILKACNNLLAMNIAYPSDNIDWLDILNTKTNLQHLHLGGLSPYQPKFSFGSLLSTLTTKSPDITSIVLKPHRFTDGRPHSENMPADRKPCMNLEKVIVNDEVWTIPYLKYLTTKAPNLVYVRLGLRYEKNLDALRTTLEYSLKKWSKTLKELWICYFHDEDDIPDLKGRHLLSITFHKMMERLTKLELVGIQFDEKSVSNLKTLKILNVAHANHEVIVTSLSDSSVLKGLEKLGVDSDKMEACRSAIKKRPNSYVVQSLKKLGVGSDKTETNGNATQAEKRQGIELSRFRNY